jgi:MFS superfamily sulfate permease-like transporter
MDTGQTPSPDNNWVSTIKHDFLASIVVFLVALPLSMGIALASGAPVAAGLTTAIIGGIVAGALAGCPFQVSGPAAGLTVIVFETVQRFGLEMLGLIVIGAGLLQILAGALRLGPWFRAVSPAVIRGMLAGIGVLIFASQFHVMIDDKPHGHGAENLATIPAAVWKSLEWPDLADESTRAFRAESLRHLGELHRRQVTIRERVNEHAPHEGERPDIARRIDSDPAAALTALVDEQQRQAESLSAFQAELAQRAESSSASPELVAAIRSARDDLQQATSALAAGDVALAVQTQDRAVASFDNVLANLKNHSTAAYIGLFTIALIILWRSCTPRALHVIPSPLIAVTLATIVATVLTLPVLYVEVPDRLMDDLRLPTMAIIAHAPWVAILTSSLLIAAVASAETLLCATAVDQLSQKSRTKYDRELVAQGVGNTLCGMLGALPMTGVIVRSSANVQAGARSRLSAILHGLWVLTFVVFLGFLLRLIPTASLAAILVYTGYKLVDIKAIKQLRQYGWGEVVIYFATVIMIVATDLLIGVVTGIVLSAIKLLYRFSNLDVSLASDSKPGQVKLNLRGAATFVRLPSLASELERVPRGAELHVDFEHLDYIDHACLDLLMGWAKSHEAAGGRLVIDWDSLHARFHGSGNGAEPATVLAAASGNNSNGRQALRLSKVQG